MSSSSESEKHIDLDEGDAMEVRKAAEKLGEVEKKARIMYDQVSELFPGVEFEAWACNNYPDLTEARDKLQRAKEEYWAWKDE